MILCELIAKELLPTIRRQTALFLDSRGMPRKGIAEEIGISEAAVSQYFSKKRGKRMGELDSLVGNYISKKYDLGKPFDENVCMLCTHLRKNGKLCYVHMITSNVPKSKCSLCSMGR
mgnify:CR=1 FL=1